MAYFADRLLEILFWIPWEEKCHLRTRYGLHWANDKVSAFHQTLIVIVSVCAAAEGYQPVRGDSLQSPAFRSIFLSARKQKISEGRDRQMKCRRPAIFLCQFS